MKTILVNLFAIIVIQKLSKFIENIKMYLK